MTNFEQAHLAQRELYRIRADRIARELDRIGPATKQAAAYRRLLAMYRDILGVIERHNEAA